MSKPIQQSIRIIQEAKEEINITLKAPEFVHNLLPINTLFDRILTRLQYMGGVLEPDKHEKVEFPPITSFMGEEIIHATKITPADLNPKEAEKQDYLNKVNKLYAEFESIAPEGILNSYTNKEDVLVLRGVAKKAGVEDYADREINLLFIDKIAAAIKAKAQDEKLQAKIDKELAGQNKGAIPIWSSEVTDEMESHKVTEENIAANPSMVEAGIKVGDTIGIPKQKTKGGKGNK